ncbi:universal stress protein [Haloarchaeobius salinus]|uniref:universal stress protein n=1 Tax=Haloarchaeobius salinus TaxID=1198298 RepID=UPI00210BD244|nr:universal stress protein [Haloarchaeobius salinus]
MYSSILVPTDGSEHAERGIEHGMDLAAEHGATLHVLFVVDENVYGSTPALSSYEAALERLADDAEDLVGDVVEDAIEHGIETTTAVRRGVPHQEILTYASENDIDAIVMGKRGASGEPGEGPHHLGSVTDRVLRGSEVPVTPV